MEVQVEDLQVERIPRLVLTLLDQVILLVYLPLKGIMEVQVHRVLECLMQVEVAAELQPWEQVPTHQEK
tara:strand:+ start:347 stop:553 length:207 start_codon:yes stop_codon:yes gene_type:complete